LTTDTLVLLKLVLIVGLLAWFGYSQLRSLKRDGECKSKPADREDHKRPNQDS
jgi:hypothetical protein